MREVRPEGKKLVFLADRYINAHRAYLFYRRGLETTLRKVRVDGERLRGGIDFYSFRHTFRSRLEECGVTTATAETIIGHSDRSFKFTYIHLSDQALVEAINRLEYGAPGEQENPNIGTRPGGRPPGR